MYNYCTLFDSNYLSRGIVMYESLKKVTNNFKLYIFAFDDRCYRVLKRLNLEYVEVISLKDFENEELLKVKSERTKQEYCWTSTPSVIKYTIEKYNLPFCTYIDADLYFYSNPNILIDEMGSNSILLTEHRYTKKYDKTKRSGRFCVQFITFKNDRYGMEALEWWRKECLLWCYARVEKNRFGDQKYLDDWPERFKGVYISQNRGCGVAPWNIQQYRTKDLENIIFYHFHRVKFLKNNKIDLGKFYLSKEILKVLYKPYLMNLIDTDKRLNQIENYDYNGTSQRKITIKEIVMNFIRILLNIYNIYNIDKILSL